MKIQNFFYKNSKWSSPMDGSLDSENTMVLCFYDPEKNWQDQFLDLKNKYPQSKIIGCSSAGEIFETQVFDHSISVAVSCFEKTQLKQVQVDISSAENSFALGAQMGQQLIGKDLCYVLVLSDGLNVNGTDLSEGITSVVGKGNSKVVVSGGLAGDGSRFKTTSILFGNQADSKKVVAMGFYSSDLKVGTGSIGGWDAFGPERKVTESKDNILYKLDDQPALSLYKTYLGSQSEKLPASALLFPLSISMENRKNVVRTVLAVDEKNQSMTFAGDIPQGASVQLMKANFTNLIQGAADAGSVALSTILDQNLPSLTVAISCVGRRLVLGERIEDETEALKKVLPEQTSIVGFYSYGELSPFGYSACELHNQTMTVSIIQEK